MKRLIAPLLLACLVLAPFPAPSQAAESAPTVSKRATVTLLSDTDAVAPGQPYRLGLRFQLAPGWHTYGRNPGDAGVPPQLDWTLPRGTTTGEIAWPTPQRLPEGPLMTFGYTGTAMLVIPATGPGPVRLHAAWLVCDNICVPEEGSFSLDLPSGTRAPSAQAPLFTEAEATLPRPSPFPAVIGPDGTLALTGAGLAPASVRDAWFMPDQPDRIVPSGPQRLSHTEGGIALHLSPTGTFQPDQPLPGVLVLQDPSGAQTALSVSAAPGVVAAPTPLWRALAFAVLGGLILNLMPCVFPVLAMKAIAIARLSLEARSRARAHAAGYTAGIMVSFALIGVAVLVLRQLGQAVGWGFQFQSPGFVAVTAWVLFAVGLNLSGALEVSGRLAGAGQGLTLRGGALGSFFSGALAVLVATPCTAPFMSVALAAALTAPPVETVAIFLALGLGLAAPTALLSVLPGISRLLPRPGRWMEVFRQAMAFPMYAACAWLIWVGSLQAGADGVLAIAGGLVLIGFAAWALRFGRIWGVGLALAACIGAVALLPGLSATPAPAAAAQAEAERFSTTRLAALRSQGKPVFVNMTAAWCVTCLVNEKVALSPAPIRQAFDALDITMMKGDWTRQDPEISAFLQSQGRDGVPLYLFYPPGGKAPVVLPQILTQANVLDALKPYYAAGLP